MRLQFNGCTQRSKKDFPEPCIQSCHSRTRIIRPRSGDNYVFVSIVRSGFAQTSQVQLLDSIVTLKETCALGTSTTTASRAVNKLGGRQHAKPNQQVDGLNWPTTGLQTENRDSMSST